MDETTPRRAISLFSRASGFGFIVSSVAAAAASWFILGKLGNYLHDPKNAGAIDPNDVPAYATRLIDHRALVALLCVAPLLAGIMLVANARPRGLWHAIGLLGLLLVIGILLVSFVSLVAPLYQYHPL